MPLPRLRCQQFCIFSPISQVVLNILEAEKPSVSGAVRSSSTTFDRTNRPPSDVNRLLPVKPDFANWGLYLYSLQNSLILAWIRKRACRFSLMCRPAISSSGAEAASGEAKLARTVFVAIRHTFSFFKNSLLRHTGGARAAAILAGG